MPLANGPINWKFIDLVVFDLDGTLYDQRRLRLLMATQLIGYVLRSGDIRLPHRLQTFRKVREELSDGERNEDFRPHQYRIPAARLRVDEAEIRNLVGEWMETRPLVHLRSCRYPGVAELFQVLRANGKAIAVYSDYPAREKLAAMELQADFVVAATDDDVARLKPDPSGLAKILTMSEVPAEKCLLIGDRYDRDGMAARKLNVRPLIRSPRPRAGWDTFERYNDGIFSNLNALN